MTLETGRKVLRITGILTMIGGIMTIVGGIMTMFMGNAAASMPDAATNAELQNALAVLLYCWKAAATKSSTVLFHCWKAVLPTLPAKTAGMLRLRMYLLCLDWSVLS